MTMGRSGIIPILDLPMGFIWDLHSAGVCESPSALAIVAVILHRLNNTLQGFVR